MAKASELKVDLIVKDKVSSRNIKEDIIKSIKKAEIVKAIN